MYYAIQGNDVLASGDNIPQLKEKLLREYDNYLTDLGSIIIVQRVLTIKAQSSITFEDVK